MKSLPIGKARTSCRDCVFAEYNGNSQSGCEFDRLQTFQSQGRLVEAHDDFKEFNVINGFCNYHRTPTWMTEHNLDMDQANKRVQLESEPNIGLVIYDTQGEASKLSTAISAIHNLRGPHRKIKIVISSFADRGVSQLVTYVNELQADGFPAAVVLNALPLNNKDRDFDAFNKCKGHMYFGLLEHDSEVNPNLFNIINESLNVKLERITMFEGKGITVIPFSIVNSEYPNHQDYRLMVDQVRTLSQQQNSYAKI